MDKNSSLKKLSLVIYTLSLSSSVMNILMDLQIDKARLKKIYRLYSIDKYIILPTEYHL
jgi:hypothetical protein